MEEVVGSIPTRSTISFQPLTAKFGCDFNPRIQTKAPKLLAEVTLMASSNFA